MQKRAIGWVGEDGGAYYSITRTRRVICRAGGLNGALFAVACVGVVMGGLGWEVVRAWWGSAVGAGVGAVLGLVRYGRIITGLWVSPERIWVEGPLWERDVAVRRVRRVVLRRTALWLTVRMTVWEVSGRKTDGVMYFFWPPEAEVRGLCDRVRSVLAASGVEVEVR